MALRRANKKKVGPHRIECYLCGHAFDVSSQTMSTSCPGCNKAIHVEDRTVKSYVGVTALQTCGSIAITKRGRVAAKHVQCGEGLTVQGSLEGSVETKGPVKLASTAEWKGKLLASGSLIIDEGATLNGHVTVPWNGKPGATAKKDAKSG
jgi:hypothetical protein